MSAYMVDDATIDRILGGKLEHAPELCGKIPGDNFVQQGQALLRMNAKALQQRYGKDDRGAARGMLQADRYQGNVQLDVNVVQWLKSLHCLLHQCNVGDVSDSQLYKDLAEAASVYEALTDTLEYAAAEWA